MKIKKPKKPKNLTFQVFLGFLKNLKNLGFLKWVSTALYRIDDSVVLSSQTLALNRQFTISFCAEMYCSSLDCHSRLCWRKAHLARLNPYHGGVQSPLPTDWDVALETATFDWLFLRKSAAGRWAEFLIGPYDSYYVTPSCQTESYLFSLQGDPIATRLWLTVISSPAIMYEGLWLDLAMDPSLCQLQSKSAANSHFHTHFHGRASQFNGSNINSLTHALNHSRIHSLTHRSLIHPYTKLHIHTASVLKPTGWIFTVKLFFQDWTCVCVCLCV